MEGDNQKKEGYFKVYQEYNLILRAWFVSFGIGAPVIFLVNEKLYEKLTNLKISWPWVIYPFLFGLLLQVLIAFLNKTINWSIYFGEENANFKTRWLYKKSEWLSEKYGIDIAVDLITIAVFSFSTLKLVATFM